MNHSYRTWPENNSSSPLSIELGFRVVTRALGTAVPLLTARVWVLCGGESAVSTGTGLLSVGVGVRRGVARSLSNWVGVQSVRVWVMCGGAGSWASTTLVLSASTGSTIFNEDHVVTPF